MTDQQAGAEPVQVAVLEQMMADLDADVVMLLVDTFVQEMLVRADEMTAAAAAGNLDAVKHEAHALKSSAATYGATEVAALSAAVDAACWNDAVDEALTKAQELPALARRAAAAYAAWQNSFG